MRVEENRASSEVTVFIFMVSISTFHLKRKYADSFLKDLATWVYNEQKTSIFLSTKFRFTLTAISSLKSFLCIIPEVLVQKQTYSNRSIFSSPGWNLPYSPSCRVLLSLLTSPGTEAKYLLFTCIIAMAGGSAQLLAVALLMDIWLFCFFAIINGVFVIPLSLHSCTQRT